MGKRPFAKKHHRRARRNPSRMSLFGGPIRAGKVLELAFGVGVGVAVNKTGLTMLPANLTSSNTMASLMAFVLAGVEWWAASFINPDFGAAVGLGGVAAAIGQVLNAFIPSVGTIYGLSGRGTGDFVPGRFPVPQNPILDATGSVMLPPGPGLVSPGAYRRRVA